MKGGETMRDTAVKERLIAFRNEYPISLATIGREIGLSQRYVIPRWIRGVIKQLHPDTLEALDKYLQNKGY